MDSAGLLRLAFGITLAVAAVPIPSAAADNEKVVLNCVACHGVDLHGVEDLGVNLVTSKFVGSKSVPELVAFLKVGRMPGDPESVAGRPMPGFGWLPEADLTEIATYVKAQRGP